MEWNPPSPALLRRAPSPQGEGRHFRGALKLGKPPSPLGRGWPAAGAFTSRSGPGEGLFGKGSERNVKQLSDAQFRS